MMNVLLMDHLFITWYRGSQGFYNMAKLLNVAVQISGGLIFLCKVQGKALVLGAIIVKHIYQPFRGCVWKENLVF